MKMNIGRRKYLNTRGALRPDKPSKPDNELEVTADITCGSTNKITVRMKLFATLTGIGLAVAFGQWYTAQDRNIEDKHSQNSDDEIQE